MALSHVGNFFAFFCLVVKCSNLLCRRVGLVLESMSKHVEQAWEAQQRTTFLKWLNNKLKKVPDAPKIESVADLADGIALCMLLSVEFPQAQMPK